MREPFTKYTTEDSNLASLFQPSGLLCLKAIYKNAITFTTANVLIKTTNILA